MKKFLFPFYVIICSSLLFSCDESGSSYRESFTLYATVRESITKVWLDFDCTNVSYDLSNFRRHEDLKTFNVHDGSRVLARITFDVPENATFGKYSLEIIDTLSAIPIDTIAFQDSLDFLIYFVNEERSIIYPQVWSTDQYLNITFAYFPNASNPNLTKFYLCPKDVKGDTLRMRLISENTDTMITSANEKRIAYNMLSLKDVETENIEVMNNINSILSTLNKLPNDSIYVEVATSDSLHIFDKKINGWRGSHGSKRVVKMKNFFK